MPSRNERKIYIKSGIYHIYNRGVDKRTIFYGSDDYSYFTQCMALYLIPKEDLISYFTSQGYTPPQIVGMLARISALKNYSTQIELLAYCLMPNHFHLLLRQNTTRGISHFMKSLQSRYSMFHAKKYERIGPLFQGRYKAVYVGNENYFRIVMAYIHNNPSELLGGSVDPTKYNWSSYKDYLSGSFRQWIKAR